MIRNNKTNSAKTLKWFCRNGVMQTNYPSVANELDVRNVTHNNLRWFLHTSDHGPVVQTALHLWLRHSRFSLGTPTSAEQNSAGICEPFENPQETVRFCTAVSIAKHSEVSHCQKKGLEYAWLERTQFQNGGRGYFTHTSSQGPVRHCGHSSQPQALTVSGACRRLAITHRACWLCFCLSSNLAMQSTLLTWKTIFILYKWFMEH